MFAVGLFPSAPLVPAVGRLVPSPAIGLRVQAPNVCGRAVPLDSPGPRRRKAIFRALMFIVDTLSRSTALEYLIVLVLYQG